jgi:gliding motility-associated-like protein
VFSTGIDPDYVFGGIAPNGQLLWLQALLINGGDPKTTSVTADCNGIYFTGVAQNWIYWNGPNPGFKSTNGSNDIFVCKFANTNGTPLAYTFLSSAGGNDEIAYDLANDGLGNIYVTGTYKSSLALGSSILPNANSGAAFVFSLDNNLSAESNTFVNVSPGLEIGYSLCMTNDGDLFMAGKSNGDLLAGQDSDNNSYDGFFVHYEVVQMNNSPCCSPISYVCPTTTQVLFCNNTCTAELPNYIEAYNDAITCPLNIITQTPPASTMVGVGQHTVSVFNNNTLLCSLLVEVVDTIHPFITCPVNQVINLDSNCAAITPDLRSLANASASCSPNPELTIIQSPPVGTPLFDIGVTPITLTVTNQSGYSSACTFDLERIDITPPLIACPANQSIFLNSNCSVILPDYKSIINITDNCTSNAMIAVVQTPAAGTSISGAGSTLVTLVATDESGISTTCNFNVLRIDEIPPSITCPSSQTLNLNSSCTAILGDYRSLATKSDNCTAAANITITQSPAAGTAVSGVGTSVVTLTATDAANNTSTCTFNVSRVDNTPPTITCPFAQTLALNATCAGVLGDYRSLATKSDNCTAAANITITQSPAAGTAVSGVGTTVVTLTARDAANNTSTCTFNVNRVDNTPPTITCPVAQTLALNATCAGVLGDYRSLATKSDNCTAAANIIITQSPAAGTAVSGVGTTVVTLTATDAANNTSTCTFNMNRVDNTPPTITCPVAQTLALNATCAGVLGDYRSLATKSDNCTTAANIIITQSPAAGTAVSGVGTTVVTLTATDAANNTSTCTFNVLRIESSTLEITCPSPSNLYLSENCFATIPDYRPLVLVAENCAVGITTTLTQIPSPGSVIESSQDVTITISATNSINQNDECSFVVSILDTIAPQLICPSETITLTLNETCTSAIPNIANALEWTDNCSTSLIFDQNPTAGATVNEPGLYEVSITGLDLFGNAHTCVAQINYLPFGEITLICPENQFGLLDANCQIFLPDYLDQVEVMQPCFADNALTWTQWPPEEYVLDGELIEEVSLIVHSALYGATSCSFDLTTIAQLNNFVSCPQEINVYTSSTCDGLIPDLLPYILEDNDCLESHQLNFDQIPSAGTMISESTIVQNQITYLGQVFSCDVEVHFIDTISPLLNCPTTPIPAQLNECQHAVPDLHLMLPYFDNCTNNSDLLWVQFPAAGEYIDQPTEAQFTIQDISGNISSCQVLLQPEGIPSATLLCPESLVLTVNENCTAPIINAIEQVEFSSDCLTVVHWEQLPIAGQNWNEENTSINIQATLSNNQLLTCEIPISLPEEIPFLTCPNSIEITYEHGCPNSFDDFTNQVAVEFGCLDGTEYNWAQNPAPGLSFMTPPSDSIAFTLTDALGQSFSCISVIEYNELIAYSIECPNEIIIQTNSECDFNVPQLYGQLRNNCGQLIETIDQHYPEANNTMNSNDVSEIILVSNQNPSYTCVVPIVYEVNVIAPSCPSDTTIYVTSPSYTVGNILNDSVFTDCLGNEWMVNQSPSAGEIITASTNLLITYTSLSETIEVCSSSINLVVQVEPIEVLCPEFIDISMGNDCTIEDQDILNAIGSIPVFSFDPYQWNFTTNNQIYSIPLTFELIATTTNGASAACQVTFVPTDLQSPLINVFQENINITPNDQCLYEVPELLSEVFASDNCSFSLEQIPAAGTTFTEPIEVTITATDLSGLTSIALITLLPIVPTPEPLIELENTILYVSPLTCDVEFNWIELLQNPGLCATLEIGTTSVYQNIYQVGNYSLGYYGIHPNGSTTDTVYFELTVADHLGPQIQSFPNDEIHLCQINDNWDLPAITDCSDFTFDVIEEPLSIGNNTVTINAVDIFQNSSSYTFDIIVHNMQWPTIMNTTSFCSNNPIIPLSNLGFDSVIWSINGSAINEFNPSLYNAGNIQLFAEAIDNSCAADTVLTLTMLPYPSHSGLDSTYNVCGNSIAIPWENDAISLNWNTDDETTISFNSNEVSILTTGYGEHPIELELVGSFCSTSTSFTVFNDEPIESLDAGNDQTIAFGLQAQLNGSSSSSSIQWLTEDNSIFIQNENALATSIEVPQLGVYTLWLYAQQGQCTKSDSIQVSFQGMVVPNTLTPNGDMANDNFIIPGDQTATVHLRIMNRWGQLIFEDLNYQNQWTGFDLDGNELPNDTYFYDFSIEGVKTTGFIQIQR